jgi:hypothetical protein
MKTASNLALQFTGLTLIAFGNDWGLVLLIPAFVQLLRMETGTHD